MASHAAAASAPAAGGCCHLPLGPYAPGGPILVTPSVARPGVDMALHAENRARLCALLKERGVPPKSIVFLAGGPSTERHDTGACATLRRRRRDPSS